MAFLAAHPAGRFPSLGCALICWRSLRQDVDDGLSGWPRSGWSPLIIGANRRGSDEYSLPGTLMGTPETPIRDSKHYSVTSIACVCERFAFPVSLVVSAVRLRQSELVIFDPHIFAIDRAVPSRDEETLAVARDSLNVRVVLDLQSLEQRILLPFAHVEHV
jgi:hypothetical protein